MFTKLGAETQHQATEREQLVISVEPFAIAVNSGVACKDGRLELWWKQPDMPRTSPNTYRVWI